MLSVFRHDEAAHERLQRVLEAPSLYDEFLRHLARRDYAVPADCIDRDFTEPHRRREDLLPVFKAIYDAPKRDWEAYEMCEELVDVEESFQLWRFRHMKTVERIIGHKRGTGGSSGVGFLRAALDLTFFPELLDVRTEIGRLAGRDVAVTRRGVAALEAEQPRLAALVGGAVVLGVRRRSRRRPARC